MAGATRGILKAGTPRSNYRKYDPALFDHAKEFKLSVSELSLYTSALDATKLQDTMHYSRKNERKPVEVEDKHQTAS